MQRDRILQDEIDLGFVDGQFQSSEIDSRPVALHRLMALLPCQHPLAAKSTVTVEELSNEDLVMGTNLEWPTLRRIVVEAFQRSGHVLSVAQEASSLTGILGLVMAGVGITVFCGVPRFCGEAIAARPLAPEILVETHLSWRRKGLSDAMRRFVETSQEVAKQYRLE
jgi:DNA-binding transcriptional LysR family regulator